MPYNIKQYTYDQAKKLGVEIKHSTNKTKKIDDLLLTLDLNLKPSINYEKNYFIVAFYSI